MDSTTNVIEHKFDIAITDPDQLTKYLEQAIYTPDDNGVRYEPDILSQIWDAPVGQELLGLFPDGTLEYWYYVDNPKVACIRVATNESTYEEEFVVLPLDSLWQTNRPLISIRVRMQEHIYHLSLFPVTETRGAEQVVRRIMYRAIERSANTQDRYVGIAKVWANLQTFDAIKFLLDPKLQGGIAVTSKCDSRFEPFYNMLLDKLGVTKGQSRIDKAKSKGKKGGRPSLKANTNAVARLNQGEERIKNFNTWKKEYEQETLTDPDHTPSGAHELYRKSVWDNRKKQTGKN